MITENVVIAGLGTTELLIILVVVIPIFAGGLISNRGRELGNGISAFRKGVQETKKSPNFFEKEESNA